MEVYTLTSDIKVFSVTAASFPDGISDAFKTLRELLPTANNREFFGISSPNETGNIVYRAAVAEKYPGEGTKYGCAAFTISKGEYLGTEVSQFQEDLSVISKTFKTLLSDPRIDPNGFCLEVYLSDEDVMCMVPLNSGLNFQRTAKNKPGLKQLKIYDNRN